MNVLDTNTPLPDLIKVMERNPDAFYEESIDTGNCLFGIQPALRFVLSYWSDPRPLSPQHIMSLTVQLSGMVVEPYDEEGEAILLKHVGAMKIELKALYERDKAAKELAFV